MPLLHCVNKLLGLCPFYIQYSGVCLWEVCTVYETNPVISIREPGEDSCLASIFHLLTMAKQTELFKEKGRLENSSK